MAHRSNGGMLPTRIVKETQRLMKEPVSGISITPYPDNPRHFKILISGPEGTPYEGGIFKVEMFLTDGYPMAPPKVRMMTKIYQYEIIFSTFLCV